MGASVRATEPFADGSGEPGHELEPDEPGVERAHVAAAGVRQHSRETFLSALDTAFDVADAKVRAAQPGRRRARADVRGRTGTAAPRGEGGAPSLRRRKLAACRWFFRWELPAIGPALTALAALDPTCLEVKSQQL